MGQCGIGRKGQDNKVMAENCLDKLSAGEAQLRIVKAIGYVRQADGKK